jgi:hypothetical protein
MREPLKSPLPPFAKWGWGGISEDIFQIGFSQQNFKILHVSSTEITEMISEPKSKNQNAKCKEFSFNFGFISPCSLWPMIKGEWQ